MADLIHARLSIPVGADVDTDIETELVVDNVLDPVPVDLTDEDDPEVMDAVDEAEMDQEFQESI